MVVGFLIRVCVHFRFFFVEKNDLCFSICLFTGSFLADEVRVNLLLVAVPTFMTLMANVI